MKKNHPLFSLVLMYFCILALFCLGIGTLLFSEKESRFSSSENRTLQAYPMLTWNSVISGEYMEDFESYLSDAFPGREGVISISRGILEAFSLPDDGVPQAEIDTSNLVESDPSEALPEEPSCAPVPAEAEEPVQTPSEDFSSSTISAAGVHDADMALISADGRRDVVQTYPAAGIAEFAEILNEYRSRLGDGGTVHYLCVPVSSVGNSISLTHKYVDLDCTLDEELQPLVDEGVYIYDAGDIYRDHWQTEAIYSTADHHWNPIGASLAADAMLERQNVPVASYWEYAYRLDGDRSATPYDHAAMQAAAPDKWRIPVMLPFSPVDSYLLRNLTELSPADYILSTSQTRVAGYWCYLGGVKGPWRLMETGFQTGRTCLVLGDSFTQAFVPYLAPYYDRILLTDLRSDWYKYYLTDANIARYMQEYNVSDVYVINCTTYPFYGSNGGVLMKKYLDYNTSFAG